jgi:hypothetical protein
MLNRVYCTYFDHNYLSRGLALYYSLQRQTPGARLWVLCLSDTCHRMLISLNLPALVPVHLEDLEVADGQLAATKLTRSTVEYYFTCTPAWLLYVAEHEAEAEWVTYLDGDLYFFTSPDLLYEELVDAAIAIVPHRFAPNLKKRHVFGAYNVGWVGVRSDPDGISVIKWWRERCIEWCYDRVDGDRYADQGYLGSFARLSARVKVIQHVGANLAPWNIANHRIGFCEGQVIIDRQHPLIFFHFQGVRTGWRWFIFNSHRIFGAPFYEEIRDRIYRPYIDEMLGVEKRIGPLLEIERTQPQVRSHTVKRFRDIGIFAFRLLDIVSGRAFFVLWGKVY